MLEIARPYVAEGLAFSRPKEAAVHEDKPEKGLVSG